MLAALEAADAFEPHAKTWGGSPVGSSASIARRWAVALLYAYAAREFSSRRIAALAESEQGLQHILGQTRPSFRELRVLRDLHSAAVEHAMGEVLTVLAALGLRRLVRIALASIHHAPTPEAKRAAGRQTANALLQIAAGVDHDEDAEFGPDVRGDEIPDALADASNRRARIASATMTMDAQLPEAPASVWDEQTQLIDLAELEGGRLPGRMDEPVDLEDAMAALDAAFSTPRVAKPQRPSGPAVAVSSAGSIPQVTSSPPALHVDDEVAATAPTASELPDRPPASTLDRTLLLAVAGAGVVLLALLYLLFS